MVGFTLRGATATWRSRPLGSSSRTPKFGRLYRTGDSCRIDIRTLRVHFLGRIDAQLKVRGHRVETQPVEDILQTQFQEIEAAVLDYQNEELIAFVAAPSVAGGRIPVVAPAPPEWAARVTERLSAQLPAPSVPTRIFLVERFVTKPVSGKIDRECLPDLSRLLPNGESDQDTGEHPTTRRRFDGGTGRSAEVLAICHDVFDRALGWDDVFADHGGHSIVIARLANRLRAAGWDVSVRALLTDRNTARKVAHGSRELPQASAAPSAAAQVAG